MEDFRNIWQLTKMRMLILVLILGLSTPGFLAIAQNIEDPIVIGGLHDLTGAFNIYGIQQSQALKLAVEDINANGGVLERPLEIVEYDTQSSDAQFSQYATTLALRDQVEAVFGGLASSSRETVRPIINRFETPYFYSALYEGGVCDKYTFLTGTTPSQQLNVLMQWAIDNFGDTFYIVAPDYNFGTITGQWVHEYANEYGAEVVGEDFIPVSVSDFGSTITKIQAANPAAVVALPVGSNQTSFFEQFAQAGLKTNIGVISTNYGSGNQQVVVSSEAGEGIITSAGYLQEVETPENERFVEMWTERYGNNQPIISEAADTWNAVHLWALAVNKAGTLDTDAVIAALESGLTFNAPQGEITLEPTSHHLTNTILIGRGDASQGFEILEVYENVPPLYENEVCDLVQNPNTSTQHVP